MTSLQAINRSAAGVMINTSLPAGCQSHEQFTVIGTLIEKIISRKHLVVDLPKIICRNFRAIFPQLCWCERLMEKSRGRIIGWK